MHQNALHLDQCCIYELEHFLKRCAEICLRCVVHSHSQILNAAFEVVGNVGCDVDNHLGKRSHASRYRTTANRLACHVSVSWLSTANAVIAYRDAALLQISCVHCIRCRANEQEGHHLSDLINSYDL